MQRSQGGAESNKGRCSPALNATLFNGIVASGSVTDSACDRWHNAKLLLLIEHTSACRTAVKGTSLLANIMTTDAIHTVCCHRGDSTGWHFHGVGMCRRHKKPKGKQFS